MIRIPNSAILSCLLFFFWIFFFSDVVNGVSCLQDGDEIGGWERAAIVHV